MCTICLDPMHPQILPTQHTPSWLLQPFCPLLGFGNSRVQFIFFNPMKNIKLVIQHAFACTVHVSSLLCHRPSKPCIWNI